MITGLKINRAVQDILEQLPETDEAAIASMLPPDCYTSPEFFEFERRRVFTHTWICVGHQQQIPQPGDYLAVSVAAEPLLIVRSADGTMRAMSALCQHRGQIITRESGTVKGRFLCPLHYWSYDLQGNLVGAPRMGDAAEQHLCATVQLPAVNLELWHGFIFVNLDPHATPLAPSLEKVEPFWSGYEQVDLVAIPPTTPEHPLPWNWKVHFENFTDAYHPEFVHRGTHDFAPSIHPSGGVKFTEMTQGDNAIARTVPLVEADGGMMADGWGKPAAFPPIETLSPAQRQQLTFVMIPPSMTLVFTPNSVAYTLVKPVGAQATFASNDRITAGGWLLPRSTAALPDFQERAALVQSGASKVWAQDVPINLGLQSGKHSQFLPKGCYGPLETTLSQFNEWLFWAYRRAASTSMP